MRTKLILIASAAVLMTTSLVAQSIEYDDMYFNSKDRKKLNEKQASEQAAYGQSPASRHNKSNAASGDIYADNTQSGSSYAARNQNPEYTARANSKEASDDEEYFSSNYRTSSSYANASNFENFNNSYGGWYNSPWVANNYWGSSIYGWNSPYYGSPYDTWGSPWANPYYRSGWSASYSFYGGNSYGYGYGSPFHYGGMGMAMAFNFGSPYNNYYGGMGNPYYGSGYGAGYYGYGSAGYVDYGNHQVYGKRGSQNGVVTRRQALRNIGVQPGVAPADGTIGTGRPTYNGTPGGRMAATPSVSAPSRGQVQRQDDYYNRNWRTARQGDSYGGSNSYSQPSRSSQSATWNNPAPSQGNRSGYESGGRSTYSGGSGGSSNGGGGAPASSGTRSRVRD